MLTTLTTPLRSAAAAAAAAAVDGVDPSPATRPRACVCLGAIERASTSDECLLSGISVTRGLINNKYCWARTRRRFAAHRDARLENLRFQCECSRWRRTWRARDRAWYLKMSRRRPGRRRV